jgi:hypothetical protein
MKFTAEYGVFQQALRKCNERLAKYLACGKSVVVCVTSVIYFGIDCLADGWDAEKQSMNLYQVNLDAKRDNCL